jgi:hypothetical protein
MSMLKVAAFAAAVVGGAFALAPIEAQAQHWGHPGWHGHRYHAPQPQYVHPKILRKKAELEARVYQKYGYAQPQYHYRPHHYQQHHYGYRPHGQSFYYSW